MENSYKNIMDFCYKFNKQNEEDKDIISNEIDIIYNESDFNNLNNFTENIIEKLELSYKQIFLLKSTMLYVSSYIINELQNKE